MLILIWLSFIILCLQTKFISLFLLSPPLKSCLLIATSKNNNIYNKILKAKFKIQCQTPLVKNWLRLTYNCPNSMRNQNLLMILFFVPILTYNHNNISLWNYLTFYRLYVLFTELDVCINIPFSNKSWLLLLTNWIWIIHQEPTVVLKCF